jgi:tRNA-modifying protein YgfZ
MSKKSFSTHLTDRAVLHITGEDALGFLDGLVTCDMNKLMPRFGALLSPQGKILFDFIIHRAETGFYIDCAKNIAADFVKRLGFYKLRAKVDVKDVSGELGVYVEWGTQDLPLSRPVGHPLPQGERDITATTDPRLEALGIRCVELLSNPSSVPSGHLLPTYIEYTQYRHVLISISGIPDMDREKGRTAACETNYHAHRIALGVPEGGKDFAFGEAFPHEVLMDQLNGVDFKKGCYVGQEVVSRMQHRGTARTRMMQVVLSEAVDFDLPAPILAGGKAMGELRTVSDLHGLALVRIDRVSEAMEAGLQLMVADKIIHIKKPNFADFTFPVVESKG